MVYRSNSSTHLNTSDVNNVLPIPTVNHKSSSYTNLTLPPPLPPAATDYDPGKQARRSVRRLSIDIERLRLKKEVTTLCTTKRRNSVCRSASDLTRSGLYDDLKSLKTQRNECVQKLKSDRIAVPCTTTSKTSIAPSDGRQADGAAKITSWVSEGLELDSEQEEKHVNRIPISVPLERLTTKTVDWLLAIKTNQTVDKLKILCLYCDRTFSSQTLYAKHCERVHQAPEGRRLSARKSNSSSLLYPGCSHCHNGKTTSLLNEELPALFHHLIDIHFDKYFACKPCTVRFPTKEALQTHLDQMHKGTALKTSPDKRKTRIERRMPDNVPAKNFSQPLSIQVDLVDSFDDRKDDEKSSSDEPILRSSRRQQVNRSDSTKATSPRKARILRNEETILSRLGITQNRSPRTRRGLKTRAEAIRAETPIIRPTRNKNTRSTNNSSGLMIEGIEGTTRSAAVAKIESLSSTFDECFYESVSSNVRQNLSCHLDGKIQSGPMSPSPISPVGPVPTVRSTLVTSPLVEDNEIHEATAISALTAFPTLLTASQYGAEPMPVGKIKKPITKNSWKWKWDCVKKYKYVNEGGKVVKKVKQPVAGFRDLSKLDMWTQLTMRTKHETVQKLEIEVSGEESCLAVGEVAREDKRKLITQLNKILDTRILPQINLEQNDQRVVKLEVEDNNAEGEIDMKPDHDQPNDDLLTILQVARKPATASTSEEERVLSGEWARPRCYICYGCGEKFENIRRLEDHKNNFHPHVYSTHYEIVGKELIEGDLFRHFYIPSTALRGHSERLMMDRKVEVEDSMDSVASFSISCSKSDSFDMDSNSRNSKVSAISNSMSVVNADESAVNDVSNEQERKRCTKCERSYNTLSELYRHMLDCSGDYDWFLAKKRHNIKYRYFGSRRRKINRTNFGNRRPIRPKKEESDVPRIRDTQTPKPRPSDAESIQRMLANLPAKRVCRQIFPNLQAKKRALKFMPTNSMTRNRQHLKPTNTKTNRNFKFIATTQTTVNAIRKNISRRLRFFAANNANEMVRSTRSARITNQQQSSEEATEETTESEGAVKSMTRRTQRLFPKLANTFRRPLQKRNLRDTAGAKAETTSSSILDRIRKSKRVQVTIKKLDENIVDLVKHDEKKTVDEPQAVECRDKIVKKQNIKRLIKRIRGRRTGSKKTIESVEVEAEIVQTSSQPDVKIEIDEIKQVDEPQEIPTQIDETSQSSSRSGSSRKSKRNAAKNQKSIEAAVPEAIPNDNNVEVEPATEETKVIEPIEHKHETVTADIPTDEPMDLSQSKTKLSVPVALEPIKTPPMKRRTRKLNDCIAMLTGKLQEKLGVPFINSETNILLSPSKSGSAEKSDTAKADQQKDDAKNGQKSSTEPSSSHSTPTKRGSRSPKSTEQKSKIVTPPAIDQKSNVVSPLAIEQKSNAVTPPPVEQKSNVVMLPAVEQEPNVVPPPEIEQESSVVTPPAIEQESNAVTPPATEQESNVVTPPAIEQESNAVTPPAIEQKLSVVTPLATEQESNDVTPLATEQESNDVTSPAIEGISKSTSNDPALTDAPAVVLTVTENEPIVVETSTSVDAVPKEQVEITTPTVLNSALEATPVDIVVESRSKNLAATPRVTKRSGKSKSKKPTVEPEKMQSDSCLPDNLATANAVTEATETTVELNETKDINLQEATIPSEVGEPSTLKDSTAGRVSRKRQTKNSSPKSSDSVKVDESSSAVASSSVDEVEIIPENTIEVTNQQKPAKARAVKNKSKNSSTNSSSPGKVEPLNNVVTPENVEKPVNSEKNVKRGRKSKKISVASETKLPEVETPQQPNAETKDAESSEDEMHPWDPEIGFIKTNIEEPVALPAPVSESNEKTRDTTSSSSDPINEIIPPLTTKKKRRKNELAKIIADQLLESFKEVDKSRIEELRMLHDLSIESNDDLLLSTTMSRTPPPKRRTASNVRKDTVVDTNSTIEDANISESVDKTTSKRKKANDNKKSLPIMKIGKKKKNVTLKANKKDSRKKVSDIPSSGYLSDTEISQQKKAVVMRRRLTICDELPKRMSRNSKETEVPISLFDSFKKRKNIGEFSTKVSSNDVIKVKPQPKLMKRKNKRNLLQHSTDDLTKNLSNNEEPIAVEKTAQSSDKCEDNEKSKANVNDLVTQIINDFTTSTLNSPTTSPILFGDLAKPRLNTVTKLSTVLNNKKNILNGETLANGFKSDVSKEITFATLSQPLKDKTVEQLRNTDSSTSDAKQPFRAPFMSPRWDPSDEWNGTTKPIKDPTLHKLWTLNNKDEQLSGDKSLYQSVKEKTKKLLGKISRKKSRKHDGTLNNKKSTVPVAVTKRPLLRPSILSLSNHTAKVDAVDTENCLKTLETNSLFLGKISNFENDANSKIFRNDKVITTTSDKVEATEIAAENFSKKSDTVINNLKSNLDKEDWKTEKKFDENVTKCKKVKNDRKVTVEAVDHNRLSKQNVRKKPQSTENEQKDALKTDNVDKATGGSAIPHRKMGSTKRKTKTLVNNPSDDLNKPICSKTKSTTESTAVEAVDETSGAKSLDESTQETISSEIVSKVRTSNVDHESESDEDLSLAEIAKNLNNKTGNESIPVEDAVPIELSESFVDNSNFSALVAVLNDQLDPKQDEKEESVADCEEDDVEDGEFINDTNTDLIDMDLEDSASVYTSSTVTTSGGSPKKRKRRHGKSILMKSSRKAKRNDGSFVTPGESFFCDLCSKTFRTQGGLATHRTTLTHISKLSEQEFKQKMETPKESSPESKTEAEEDITTKPDVTTSPIIESSSQPQIPFNQSPLSSQRHPSTTSPVRNQSLTYLNNIEPISSPEQHDFNYDRYSTRPRNSSAPSHDSSRIALSQEQRFFYECCSMLKGSDRSNINPSDSPNKYYTLPERTDVITKPVTPRSNEQYSYVVPEGSKHSKGIPKIDLNQFSDISSDSNPAFSCPQNPSSSETQNIFPMESKRIAEKRDYHSPERNFDAIKKDAQAFNERTTILEGDYHETYSDMGDSFPSSQDVSESEQYTQTILERSSNSDGLIRGGYLDDNSTAYGKSCDDNKKPLNTFTIAMESNETKGLSNSSPVESPLHSTSSQSSTMSKPRTKAAMKGYDNFKISIPTTGIDLQQALNRSPNASGCKLAALADIALGNDVPNVAALMRPHPDVDIETSHTPPEPPIQETVPEVSVPKQTVSKKGTKLGANNRKKTMVSPKTPKKPVKTSVRTSPKSTPKSQPKDVYDFEDFDDSTDAPILTLSQARSKPAPPPNVDEEDSETSSYSDRLDFNYESMSESDTSVDNLQKKCLIERIFKSVKKTDVKEKEKVEPKKPIPKQELDKLFDGLRQTDKNAKTEEKKVTEKGSSIDASKQIEGKFRNERSRDRQSKKSREIANLEEEWGMSMNQIAELIGVGQRKTQRRCAANKQKTFAENWSSDEYEDFHTTNDIFALIREAEMKAGRARSRTARSNAKRERQQQNDKTEPLEDSTSKVKSKTSADCGVEAKDKENKATTDDKSEVSAEAKTNEMLSKVSEPTRRSYSKSTDSKTSIKKPAKVKRSKSFVATESDDSDDEFHSKKMSTVAKPQKIKNRRQTISSRQDLHKTAKMSNGARVKPNRSTDAHDVKPDGKSKNKAMSRRKRKASEMLYYWSSSSDEEFGRIKPRDDNFDDDNLEQHGWIVGDSHKKLVTLLAHAKGKKIEDCAVKKAIHKKKS